MNVFWLDLNPTLSARYACDQHVVKMPTEHAQMLMTVLDELGFGKQPMQPVPMSKRLMQWVYEDWANFAYLYELSEAYYEEYVRRYGKRQHRGWLKLARAVHKVGGLRPIRLAYRQLGRDRHSDVLYLVMRPRLWQYVTVPPLYMDEQYQRPLFGSQEHQMNTVVACYRDFYREDKIRFARYRNMAMPEFMNVVPPTSPSKRRN